MTGTPHPGFAVSDAAREAKRCTTVPKIMPADPACTALTRVLGFVAMADAVRPSTSIRSAITVFEAHCGRGFDRSGHRPNQASSGPSDGHGGLQELPVENVGADAVGHSRRRRLDRIPRQMRVSRGRVNLVVAQELTDHDQALTERQCPQGKKGAEIMMPRSYQLPIPHAQPRNKPGRRSYA